MEELLGRVARLNRTRWSGFESRRGHVDENEPDDYDGYVDYICGRIPGLDGMTFVDGSKLEETPDVDREGPTGGPAQPG